MGLSWLPTWCDNGIGLVERFYFYSLILFNAQSGRGDYPVEVKLFYNDWTNGAVKRGDQYENIL